MALFMETFGTGTDIPEPHRFTPCQMDTRFQNMAISDSISESSRASVTREIPLENVGKRTSVTGNGHLFSFQKAKQSMQTHQSTPKTSPPVLRERSFLQNEASEINESGVMDSTFLYDPFEIHDKTTILFTGTI